MPHHVELCLSVAITAGAHIGLGDQAGRAINDFLGLFTDYAPLPALYVAYSLCVWLSVLAACVALRRLLFGQRPTLRKPPRKRNRPPRRPQNLPGNTTGTQREPVQPAPVPRPRQVPGTRSNKGEQARRLREVRGGGQPNRPPVYSNSQPLWNSPHPKVSPLIAINILTDKVNLPKPAAVSVESQKLPVSVSGQPQVPVVTPARERHHKHRVSPGPYLPYSPATCVRGAYDDEFNRWRQGEAKREKRCVERGVAFVEKPFDPTGNRACAAQAKTELAVSVPKPAEKPSVSAVEEPFKPVEELAVTSAEETSKLVKERAAPAVESIEPVSEPAASVAESSEPAPVPAQLSSSVVSKVKARIEKVKNIKARAHSLLSRQVETMSLVDRSVRPVKASAPSPKRKLRNPRRSFEPKPVKRTFEAMDVDYSGDSMEVDPPCPVDELADLFSRISISSCTA